MSHSYHMHIEVQDVSGKDQQTVADVISEEWGNDDPYYNETEHSFSTGSENQLAGGESPDEFTKRLSEAIWTKLGRFVDIEVSATDIEAAPVDTYMADEEDYKEWLAKKKEKAPSTSST